jgi:hypothetical protein
MSSLIRRRLSIVPLLAASLVATFVACTGDAEPPTAAGHDHDGGDPHFTAASGSSSVLLGRATFSVPKDPVLKIVRDTGDWRLELKAKPALDIAVQRITFAANGGNSGWHRHPGPVFIQVVSGTMTFYESDDPTCTPIVKKAGEGYLDLGAHAHFARNETAEPAENIVTYFAPPGMGLRIDEPLPTNCPF